MKKFLKQNGFYLFEVLLLTFGFISAQSCNPPNKELYSILYCILLVLVTALTTKNDGGGTACG